MCTIVQTNRDYPTEYYYACAFTTSSCLCDRTEAHQTDPGALGWQVSTQGHEGVRSVGGRVLWKRKSDVGHRMYVSKLLPCSPDTDSLFLLEWAHFVCIRCADPDSAHRVAAGWPPLEDELKIARVRQSPFCDSGPQAWPIPTPFPCPDRHCLCAHAARVGAIPRRG